MNWIVHGFSGITFGELVAAEICRNPVWLGITVSLAWACLAGLWAYLWWVVLPSALHSGTGRQGRNRCATGALIIVGASLLVVIVVGVPPIG